MTEDASQRLRRLLSVIPLFAETECISHEELAQRTGISAPDLLDDLRAVTERWHAPGGFVEDLRVEFEPGTVSVHSSHFQRPMRISIPELCALELGLAMLAAASPPDERVPIDRARAKLRQAIVKMPGMPRDDSWQVPNATVDGAIVGALHEAAKTSTKVRITYQSGRAPQTTARVIHPYALLPSHGTWYVIAHCESSDGLRFFRADRVESVDAVGETFARPTKLPVLELLHNGKPFHGSGSEQLVVRYSARIARWIAEREGKSVDADGSLTVHHSLADDHWGVRHVLQYGPKAEVLSPLRLRQRVNETLEAMLG